MFDILEETEEVASENNEWERELGESLFRPCGDTGYAEN